MNQWTAQASQLVSASVVYTKISSNELLEWQLFGRADESNTVPVQEKRKSWGDRNPTTILRSFKSSVP